MAEFLLPVRGEEPRQGIRTSRGRVPEVSLHTAVKGQFGLGTGRAMGKALKKAMFLGKLYRKKRALLLPGLPTPKKKPPPDMSYWCPPVHDVRGREHQWYEACYRSHGAMCGCGNFINHLAYLGERYGFRPGNRGPGSSGVGGPPPPLRRALPAPPAPEPSQQANNNNNQRWPGDGGNEGGAAGGEASSGDAALPEDDLDGLLAALDDEE